MKLPKDCVRWLYLAVLASLLVSCALALSGCVTLYPEYMTGSCIGVNCGCSNNAPAPDTTGEPGRRQIERVIK